MVWPIIRGCGPFGSLHLTDAAFASQRKGSDTVASNRSRIVRQAGSYGAIRSPGITSGLSVIQVQRPETHRADHIGSKGARTHPSPRKAGSRNRGLTNAGYRSQKVRLRADRGKVDAK